MKKTFYLIISSMLLLTACPKEDKKDVITVGVSLPTQREEGWVQAFKEFEEYGKSHEGVEVKIQSADTQLAAQNSQINSMITAGVDILIIAPTDSKAVSSAVNIAHAEGIPVLAYDRLISGTPNVTAYFSYDNVEVGRLQGQYLLENAPKGNYIILSGAPTDNNSRLFKQGAMEILQPAIAAGDIKVIAEQSVEDWLPINAKKIVTSAITVNPDIDAILAPNDGTAGGAISALEKEAIEGVLVTGQDAQVDAIQRIQKGSQAMTVFKDNKFLARKAIETAVQIVKGEFKIPSAKINNGSAEIPYLKYTPQVVTKDNIQVLIDSDYLDEKDIRK